jgi:hypothetical protein
MRQHNHKFLPERMMIMPHTLELSQTLGCWELYTMVEEAFYAYAKSHNLNCSYPFERWSKGNMNVSGTQFTAFNNNGITMYSVIYSSPGFTVYTWEIKINPQSRQGIDRLSVADEIDVLESFALLDSLIRDELKLPCSHSDFNINRLDCAHNSFHDADTAKLYMSLMKKGDIPDELQSYSEYSGAAHRRISPGASIYCYNRSRTVTINIYIKAAQLQTDRYTDDSYDFEEAAGLLRIEVQCSRQKLVNCQKMLRVNSLSPEPFIKDSFNYYILLYYMSWLFRKGDYYSFSLAKRIIMDSSFHKASKDVMCLMLELTSTRNGLKRAISEMTAMGYTAYDIKTALQRFDRINVNPVTIPVVYGIGFLPSTIKLLPI